MNQGQEMTSLFCWSEPLGDRLRNLLSEDLHTGDYCTHRIVQHSSEYNPNQYIAHEVGLRRPGSDNQRWQALSTVRLGPEGQVTVDVDVDLTASVSQTEHVFLGTLTSLSPETRPPAEPPSNQSDPTYVTDGNGVRSEPAAAVPAERKEDPNGPLPHTFHHPDDVGEGNTPATGQYRYRARRDYNGEGDSLGIILTKEHREVGEDPPTADSGSDEWTTMRKKTVSRTSDSCANE